MNKNYFIIFFSIKIIILSCNNNKLSVEHKIFSEKLDEILQYKEFLNDIVELDNFLNLADSSYSFENYTVEKIQIFEKLEETTQNCKPIIWITVNEIPEKLNGSKPYLNNQEEYENFHLLLPSYGFSIEINLKENSCTYILPETLTITSDKKIGYHNEFENLAPLFTYNDTKKQFKLYVNETIKFPVGFITLYATLKGYGNEISDVATYTFEIDEFPSYLDPFENTDIWILVLSRDLFSISPKLDEFGNFTLEVFYTPEGNGIPDFDEDLIALGIFGKNKSFNEILKNKIKDGIIRNLRKIFLINEDGFYTSESVNIKFLWEDEPEIPDLKNFSKTGNFNLIAIGGDTKIEYQNQGYLGMSFIDLNNNFKENNAEYGYGVFTSALIKKIFSISALKNLLSSISPINGIPFGEYPLDELLLLETFDPNKIDDNFLKIRAYIFNILLKFGTVGIAALIAHEIGHAVGLVPPGPPPKGLFGGASKAEFVVSPSDDWHIDTPGLNIMQSGKQLKIEEALTQEPSFNPLNKAYLQRRIIVNPDYIYKQNFN